MAGIVDLIFSISGERVPVDHGYALYGAISRHCPAVHQQPAVGVHAIRGAPAGERALRLTGGSKLAIRTPAETIPELLPLVGHELELDGHSIPVGVPRVLALRPSPCVIARVVTIKGFVDTKEFLEAARRQLDELGVSAGSEVTVPPLLGKSDRAGESTRRVVRIKGKTVVGFALQVGGLSGEESVLLQERGLGGRRHMGCGIFVPTRKGGT